MTSIGLGLAEGVGAFNGLYKEADRYEVIVKHDEFGFLH
jgi:hypothetical protein